MLRLPVLSSCSSTEVTCRRSSFDLATSISSSPASDPLRAETSHLGRLLSPFGPPRSAPLLRRRSSRPDRPCPRRGSRSLSLTSCAHPSRRDLCIWLRYRAVRTTQHPLLFRSDRGDGSLSQRIHHRTFRRSANRVPRHERRIAVGTVVASGPPHRSQRARQRTGLLSWVWASKRRLGQGCRMRGCGSHRASRSSMRF
jgi:hypothetical protein